jgi:hypothetical protein
MKDIIRPDRETLTLMRRTIDALEQIGEELERFNGPPGG